MTESYVARQPIFDRNLETVGYELLFRSAPTTSANVTDADAATAQTLITSVIDIGLDTLVGSGRAFLNVTRSFVLDGHASLLAPDRVVLELLEDISPDDDFLDAARRLVAGGYSLAADDFLYDARLSRLLELVGIVKLDVRQLGRDALEEHVRLLRPYGVRLVAEKVEDADEFEYCRQLDFDLYQGYFFSRPETRGSRAIPSSDLSRIQLVAKLQDPDVTLRELEEIITRDLGLSHRLLRYVNSAFVGIRREVRSIREACVLIGQRKLRELATLLVFAAVSRKPAELLVTAAVRARMCELLAGEGIADPPSAFTAGLFSVLDALLDVPMDVLLGKLPLSEDVVAALLAREGRIGMLLESVLAYEVGEELPRPPELQRLRAAHVDALRWLEGGWLQVAA